MNLVRTGIILMVIGLTVLLITSIFSPKIYNIMGETLDNFTINLDTYSEFLVPIHIDDNAYLMVSLNNTNPLTIYLLDEVGHILTPVGYRHEDGLYLVIFPLVRHGNYSLVILNDYPKILNASVSITIIHQYIVNNALIIEIMMDLGTLIFIFGAILIAIKILSRILYGFLGDIKV
ncbi:MAG: hypothetical protein TU36_000065 [Vulcanisaeta sp. AZ3]